jgi:hypothetical protein
MAGPISSRLNQEHTRLLGGLARATPPGKPLVRPAFDLFRAELLSHVAFEELVLFPELSKAAGEAFERVRKGYSHDHAALMALVLPTLDAVWLQDLRETLEHHFATEEGEGGTHAMADQYLAAREAELFARRAALPRIALEPTSDGAELPLTLRMLLGALGLDRALTKTGGR